MYELRANLIVLRNYNYMNMFMYNYMNFYKYKGTA